MALPILNNESQRLSEVIELSTEINMDGFTGLGALLEAQAKTLQSIEKILSRQYQSYLDAERERRENEREARNKIPPTGPNTDTPPSAGDDAGGFSLLGALAGGLASLIKKLKSAFKPIISVFESVITKLKSAFKPIISVFESVITKLKSVFKPIISVFESVITKLKSAFKPIISVFESVITKLKSVFKPIFSSFETVFLYSKIL
jgi:hypothetical protein